MEYKVVYGSGITESAASSFLQSEVTEYIREGFKPYGSMQAIYSCGSISLFQPMIKED